VSKPTYPLADTSYSDRNRKLKSEGGMNCEDAEQVTSEEKEARRGCRK
jgi:hypothetical protein